MSYSKGQDSSPGTPGWSVLVLSGVRGDTRRYRTLHLIEQMQLLGIQCQGAHLTDADLIRKFQKPYQAVVLHRVPYDRYVQRLISMARNHGALLLFDVDDLIFDLA